MISLLLLIYNDEARRLSISAERFPRHRAELYMLATENLLRSDYSLSERETLQFLQSEVAYSYDEQEHWIEIAAWVLHRLGEKPRAEPISRLDLKDELCKIYGQPEGAVAEFLKMVQQRSSLLEWNKGQYQFTHFAFQEFMVARYLCDVELEKKNRGIVPWLFSEGLIGANRWREPLLLAAGYLAINESKIAMLFIEMLASINQQEHTNISMLYASLELALAACEEWFANDPNYLEYYKMISERTVRLLLEGGNPQQRTTAGRALGRVGDARPGINIKESLPDILWSDPILSGVFIRV
jgi:predicted NACHT family NTPase